MEMWGKIGITPFGLVVMKMSQLQFSALWESGMKFPALVVRNDAGGIMLNFYEYATEDNSTYTLDIPFCDEPMLALGNVVLLTPEKDGDYCRTKIEPLVVTDANRNQIEAARKEFLPDLFGS